MVCWILKNPLYAGKLAFSNDFEGIKNFLDKVGSNFYLKDKKVAVDFVRPWEILLRYKALGGSGADTKEKGLRPKNGRSPIVWALLDSNQRPPACKAGALNQLS